MTGDIDSLERALTSLSTEAYLGTSPREEVAKLAAILLSQYEDPLRIESARALVLTFATAGAWRT